MWISKLVFSVLALWTCATWAIPHTGGGKFSSVSYPFLGEFINGQDACNAIRDHIGYKGAMPLVYPYTYPSYADPYCNGPGNPGPQRSHLNYKDFNCPINSTYNAAQNLCICDEGSIDYYFDGAKPPICRFVYYKEQSCSAVGNPISPLDGDKVQFEQDFEVSGAAPLVFARTYKSSWAAGNQRPAKPMGKGWTHNHHIRLLSNDGYVYILGADIQETFMEITGGWSAAGSPDILIGSPSSGWQYKNVARDEVYSFDASGKLSSRVDRSGRAISYAYNVASQLATITNSFGSTLSFTYNADGYLSAVALPDGRNYSYGYDSSGRLTQANAPDGTAVSYLYENLAYPFALSGIRDQLNNRFTTYLYNAQGKAISTELASGVNKFQLTYPSEGRARIIDPLGTTRNYVYGGSVDRISLISVNLPLGDAKNSIKTRTPDIFTGLITSTTDFKGSKTNTIWNEARRLPTSVTRAAGSAEAQTTTTEWHSTWALPVLVTEAGRTTAYTYDTQGRPLTQVVTHTAAGNKIQTTSWTYNPQGLAATETAPNGAVTSYTYDVAGNVLSATNALGHVSSYTYDSANRMLSQTARNGLITTYTWDARDRLLTQTVGGQESTTMTYKPFGAIATLTLPTGLSIAYTYDAAHRLTGWSNNRSESGSFTLDAMGNRTGEQILNSTGAIAWTTARTVNNINRLTAQTEGSNQTSTFGYDANGDRIRETNGLNQSTQFGLDGLRRVKTLTNAANASASLSYNALDAVTQANDFKGVATSYGRDAQGNATTESSADIGARSTTYDALGLPSQIVDALGQATTIQRDVLGRPTQMNFADGKITMLRYDLTGANYNTAGAVNASIGALSEIQDSAGTTSYQRDAFGRVVRKTQALVNGTTGTSLYSYNAAGLLTAIQYPGGADHLLQHVYDATGRLTAMNWKGQPLVTGITWNPMGQPTGWTWAFGALSAANGVNQATTRSYDTAGRLTNVSTGGQTVLSYVYDAAGRVTSLSQLLAEPVTPNDPNTAVTTTLRSWLAGYDATGRLTSLNQSGTGAPVDTAGFTYDANGNRTASTRVFGGTTTSRTYSVSANRLTSLSQVIGGTSSSAAYSYNANGDMISDGLRTYTYDAEGRLSTATTGATDMSPTTRYAHNALGQRVFKTEPQYPPVEGDEADAGFMQSLINFFRRLWNPATAQADVLGYAFAYDEQGSLIGEYGMGGAHSAGTKQYVYLPTAAGPMPIVVIADDTRYAIVADHLSTPRRAVYPDGALRWQWGYSAFGDEQPTVADRRFNKAAALESDFSINLRYPGQYFDAESNLHYNGFRTYNPSVGRYTQGDPIGLDGDWNRYGYVSGNPLRYTDPKGLCPVCLAGPLLGGVTLGDLGIGAAITGAMVGLDWMLSDATPPRGLPPEGVHPPIPEGDQCEPGPASRPSERDKGGQSLWDSNGGEWRYYPADKWHNPHWDHNAHDRKASPWVNIPHGNLPPMK